MITLKNVSKSYGKKSIFENLSVDFDQPSTIYALLGESGSGKTTLLHILFGLDQKYTGDYFFDGRNVREFSSSDWDQCRNTEIQIVYQDYKLLGHMTVYDNLRYALNSGQEPDEHRIREALDEMDLSELASLKASKISGGEKQRLALARAMINRPRVLLLDEPTGNLDDKNTTNAMEYIRRLANRGITVILITHDSRVLDYADIVHRIQNHTLVLEQGATDDPPQPVEQIEPTPPKQKPKKNVFRYTLTSMKSDIKDLLIHNIPIITIFVVFVLLFNAAFATSRTYMNSMFSGIGDQAIVMDLSVLKDEEIFRMNKEKISLFAGDGHRLNFLQQDIDQMSEIEGVADVVPVRYSATMMADKDGFVLDKTVTKEELPKNIQNIPSYVRAPDTVAYTFESQVVPYGLIKEFNPKGIALMFGDYPKDQTYEILIPDIYAFELAEQRNMQFDKLVGQTVTLDTMGIKEQKMQKEYQICGIYQTTYQSYINPEQSIIVSYQDTSDEMMKFMASEERYKDHKKDFDQQNEVTRNYCASIYESYDSYKAALGIGVSQVVITLDSPGQAKQVTESLNELFPNIKKLSQYDSKYGDLAGIYKGAFWLFVSVISIVALLFGIIVTFLTKSHIKRKNKEMSILYSLGYSRWSVSRISIYENLITTGIDLLVAYIILFFVHHFYLQYTSIFQMFSTIFTVNSIFGVVGFALFIMLISTLWSVFGVRKSRLKKFLET